MCHPPQVNACVTKNDNSDRLLCISFDYVLDVHVYVTNNAGLASFYFFILKDGNET